MANKHNGEVIVTLDGHEKKLRFDFNALAELEDLRGKSISALMELLAGGDLRFGFIRDALYCGMLWSTRGKRDFTKHGVGRMMQAEELEGYARAIAEGLMAALGVKAEDVEQEAEGVDPTAEQGANHQHGTGPESEETLAPQESSPMSSGV